MQHRTIKASVTGQLRKQIVSGDIAAGSPLRQESLAKQYGCSLIPIREALLSLQGEGLVEFVPHKGAVTKKIDLQEIDEIFSIRALLEADTFSRSVMKLTEIDFEKAEAVLHKFEHVLRPGTDLGDWAQINWEFHRILYEPSARNFVLNLIERLHRNCERYIFLQLRLDETRSLAHEEHRQILELARARKKRDAVKLLRDHIVATGNRLLEGLALEAQK